MAKQITRTIIKYRYTLIKTKVENGEIKVEDQKVVDFNERLGLRKYQSWLKENKQYEGYVIGNVAEVEETYAMSLEAFLQNAVKVPTPKKKIETENK